MFPSFRKFEGMFAVMSLRHDGNMKVYRSIGPSTETDNNGADSFSHNEDYEKQVEDAAPQQNEIIDKKAVANRGWFLSGLGIAHDRVVSVKPVHGDNIEIVSESEAGKFIDGTDGLISMGSTGLFLSITVADCLPVVIFEPERKIMCLLHCGWKGLEKGIIYKAVNMIKDSIGGNQVSISRSLYAGIGPGIGACHFEIKKDILPFFTDYPDAVSIINAGDRPKSHNKIAGGKPKILRARANGADFAERYFVDLKLIAKKQLQDCKISPENIEVNPECTYCRSDIFFSFRKDKKRPVDAMMALAGWKGQGCGKI